MSEHRRRHTRPSYHSWFLQHTGGGCTALALERQNAYCWITVDDDASAPEPDQEEGTNLVVGMYIDDATHCAEAQLYCYTRSLKDAKKIGEGLLQAWTCSERWRLEDPTGSYLEVRK